MLNHVKFDTIEVDFYYSIEKFLPKYMLKKLIILALLTIVVFVPRLVKAEEIKSFDVIINIKEDALVHISETITYDFGSAQKHGIFRNIPYQQGSIFKNLPLYISDIRVTDENNQPLVFNTSKTQKDLVIKIGDSNELVTGVHTYSINYIVQNVVNFFNTKDQFYWNATGNDWQVPIGAATVSIWLPMQMDLEKTNLFCYAGFTGSLDSCQEARLANPVHIRQLQLSSQNGITLRLDMPKGILRQPSLLHVALNFAHVNSLFLLPAIVFLLLLIVWIIFGKDFKSANTIITQFDVPDNLTPAEVGAIFDRRVSGRDISAEIISLAVRGYIKINQIERKKDLLFVKNDYELMLLRSAGQSESRHDIAILSALFSQIPGKTILLSSLKKNRLVHTYIKKSKKILYKDLTDKGYFKFNPNTLRQGYITIGFIILYVAIRFMSGSVFLGPLVMSGVIMMVFALVMPALTKKGALTRDYILGLKKYLEVAEKDRLEFHNAPEKNPEQFEKLLPFAMALGVEKKWAQQFEHIYTVSPGWYGSYYAGNFSTMAFVDSLSGFSGRLESSGVSGGGSAGGGRGGGGGGSW